MRRRPFSVVVFVVGNNLVDDGVVVHPTHRFRVLYHSRNQDVGISKSTSFWGGFVASDENGHWLGGGVDFERARETARGPPL